MSILYQEKPQLSTVTADQRDFVNLESAIEVLQAEGRIPRPIAVDLLIEWEQDFRRRTPTVINDWLYNELIAGSGIDPEIASLNFIYRSTIAEAKADGISYRGSAEYEESFSTTQLCRGDDGLLKADSIKFRSTPVDAKGEPQKYKQQYGRPSGIMPMLPPLASLRGLFASQGEYLTDEDVSKGFFHCLHKYPVRVYLTEGSKKAAAAVSNGLICLALQGCYNGTIKIEFSKLGVTVENTTPIVNLVHPALDFLLNQPREIFIIPDNDERPQSALNVRDGFLRLAEVLAERGAAVSFKLLEGGIYTVNGEDRLVANTSKGLDDFLLAHGLDAFNALPNLSPDAYRAGLLRLLPYRNQHYIKRPSLAGLPLPDARFIGVKSGKGSGKTQWSLDLLSNKDFLKLGDKCLYIAPRQLLLDQINSEAESREISDIGHYKKEISGVQILFICVDSIWRLPLAEWAGAKIIIDEVVLALDHLHFSSTCSRRREAIVHWFDFLIHCCPQLIVLSADLNWNSIELLRDRVKEDPYIINNQAKSLGYNLYLDVTDDQQHGLLSAQTADRLNNGENVFLYFDGKSTCKKVTENLATTVPDIRYQMVHGDNSGSSDVRHFVENINQASKGVNLLSATGSLGTGTSITNRHFNFVGAMFNCQSQTPLDMAQGLYRVRDTGADRGVSIVDVRRNETTSFQTIRQDILDRMFVTDGILKIAESKGEFESDVRIYQQEVRFIADHLRSVSRPAVESGTLSVDDAALLNFSAWSTVLRNWGMNRPVSCFRGLQELDGHKILEQTAVHLSEGKWQDLNREMGKKLEHLEREELVNTPLPSADRVKELEVRKFQLEPIEKLEIQKHTINEIIGFDHADLTNVPADQVEKEIHKVQRQIVDGVEDYNWLSSLILLDDLLSGSVTQAVKRDIRDAFKHYGFNDRRHYVQKYKLLKTTKIDQLIKLLISGEDIFSDNVLVAEVGGLAAQHRKDFKRLFNVSVGGSKESPGKVVTRVLELIGIPLKSIRVSINGNRVRKYTIPQWGLINKILEHRRAKFQAEKAQEAAEIAIADEIRKQNEAREAAEAESKIRAAEVCKRFGIRRDGSIDAWFGIDTHLIHQKLIQVGATHAAQWLIYEESAARAWKQGDRLRVDIEFDRSFLTDLQRLRHQDRAALGQLLEISTILITNPRLRTESTFELAAAPVAA